MQGLNQIINLVENRYLGSSRKYLETLFLIFTLTLKLRVVHIRKKVKNLIFSKMAPTILIKFCGLIVHSKPNNVMLANFPGKIPETGKIYFKCFPSPNAGPKPTHQSRSNSICRILLQIFLAIIFFFDLPLKLRVVHISKNYKILFSQKWLQRNWSNFVGLQFIRNRITWHSAFPEKNPETE